MSMQVSGLDDLMSKFQELERKAQKNISDKALNKAGEVVKDKIKSIAPVGETGKLRESIEKGKIKGTGSNRKIEIGNMNAGSDVTRYFYYQENGTSIMPAKKFMKRGFQNSAKDANEIIKNIIKEELK